MRALSIALTWLRSNTFPTITKNFKRISGKSTQLPQYLYENGWAEDGFQIVCTQPRRIAAQTLAQRVSEEVGKEKMGGTVGYTVRFDDCSHPDRTQIKFVTDGILLREATLQDPLLSNYSVVIVDEAHERNINSDCFDYFFLFFSRHGYLLLHLIPTPIG